MATLSFPLLRADDGLVLDVQLVDLEIEPDGDGWRARRTGTTPGAVIVTTTPQHTIEYADKVSVPAPSQPKPIFAAPSRLTFVVPPGTVFPLTVEGVLAAVTGLELVPSPGAIAFDPVEDPLDAARVDGSAGPVVAERRRRAAALIPSSAPARRGDARAGASVTAELPPTVVHAPARLALAVPTGAARFVHASRPVARDGVVEQWHTRLGLRTTTQQSPPRELPTTTRVVQAISSGGGSTDYLALVNETNINSALSSQVAKDIRSQSQTPGGELDLAHLRLSPLGATLDLDGTWATLSPSSYRHRIVGGRDEEVRVALRGRLYPFGHRATLTVTTRRDLRAGKDGDPVALRTKGVLTVRDRVMEYGDAGRHGRSWPWQRIEIRNRVSPPGDVIENTVFAIGDVFQHLEIAGRPFASVCRVTDRAGHVTTFFVPQLFVADGQNHAVAGVLWRVLDPAFRTLRLDGQPVGLAAPPAGSSTGNGAGSADATTVLATSASLDSTIVGGLPFPTVQQFVGTSPVVNGLKAAPPTTIRYAEQFLANGFGSGNAGELLLTMTGPKTALGEEAAALVSAAFPVRAVSRSLGAVASNAVNPDAVLADLAEVAAGRFDPQRWIQGIGDTKLFGVFPLGELLPAAGTLADAPRQTAELIDGRKSFTAAWSADLLQPGEEFPVGPAVLKAVGDKVTFAIDHETSLVPSTNEVRSRTTSEVSGAVLGLSLAGEDLVKLPVPKIRFETVDGAAPTVDVNVGHVDFLGPLSWVGVLARLLDGGGLGRPDARAPGGRALAAGGGPAVQVFDDRIEASLTLAIPDIAVGMFSLSDLVFRSSFDLFFQGGPPLLTMAFASPEHPFRVSVSALAGGGNLLVQLSTAGLEVVRGALEFGAAVAVNLAGIARGEASIMGGIFFELTTQKVLLGGHLRIHGHLDILGIIAVTVDLTLLVAYDTDTELVEGTAELAIKIKVLFFKKTVRFSVHQQFAGSNGDPTFAELMAPVGRAGDRPWDTYCDAFLAA